MVTDKQVRRLYKLMQSEKTLAIAAAKAGMDEKTARKYIRLGKLPSEVKKTHTWRTREDPFAEVWEEVREKLELNPGLEAKTLFEYLQRRHPERFQDGQLRTLQRKVKRWRALEGPPKEVFFPQQHYPGRLCQSDFTHLTGLNVTINGQRFVHLLYHFVLTYSNWETGTICFSESFESLSEGLQKALWELGGVPQIHQTDRLSAAIHKDLNPEVFTERYQSLLNHYRLNGQYTRAASPHENGDIEQSHHRFKRALDQSLMLRGSRDFESRAAYEAFMVKLFAQLNMGRRERLQEEITRLKSLPERKLGACKRMRKKVGPSSTIRIQNNTYSVDSRLIGEKIEVRMYSSRLELWYAQQCVDELPRLRGENNHHIEYRHIIDWLVRKPGAFENYKYRRDLFPTHRFRLTYDWLTCHHTNLKRATKEYLHILYLAAKENETAVDAVLTDLLGRGAAITARCVEERITAGEVPIPKRTVVIEPVHLAAYDSLLNSEVLS